MIFVDTSGWFASIVSTDRDHEIAREWFLQNRKPLFTTDYIVDETLTLFRSRGENTRAIQIAEEFFSEELSEIYCRITYYCKIMKITKFKIWLKNYQSLFQKGRILSQIASLIIAIGIGLEIAGIPSAVSNTEFISTEWYQQLMLEVIVMSGIVVLFGSRFFLLFSDKASLFWISQLIWLIYITLLGILSFPSIIDEIFSISLFPNFNVLFTYFFISYLIISPIRQLLIFLTSFFITSKINV